MKVFFGLQLDDLVIPKPAEPEGGVHYFGPVQLLLMLESHLGLIGHPANNEYLRIEQYRQAILAHLKTQNQPFYKASFEADHFALATELLQRRDELVLAGWNFEISESTPERLQTLAQIEAVFKMKPADEDAPISLSPGFADRFVAVVKKLEKRKHPVTELFLVEPLELLPSHFQKLFKKLGIAITLLSEEAVQNSRGTETDLSNFQKRLLSPSGKKEKIALKNDGSLLILKAKRGTEAAAYLAKLFKLNPQFRPACLIPEKSRSLDMALIQEGLPSLGILSASLARPSLQILKLVTAFLWQPIDPFKILEFVSLSVKPLTDDLATLIANEMAQRPGLNSEGWFIAINRYFEELSKRAENDPRIDFNEIKEQYDFWFRRRRYDLDWKVPKKEVLEIFEFLKEWACKTFERGDSKNNSFLVLREQSKRIVELLETLPESELTYLELERIVRTIYEPSPVVFQEKEVGHLPHTMQPGAIIGEVDSLVWWNFIQNEPVHFFSRWHQKERQYLRATGIHLETPERENALMVWQRKRPILNTQNRLLLVVPEFVNGKAVFPHPLQGDLEATFANPESIAFEITSLKRMENFEKHFQLPNKALIPTRRLGQPKPFLHIRNLDKLTREYETLTSLETLFYYPYQWVFKYQIRLNKSAILSVVNDARLMGNLAHRLFEKLFAQEVVQWEKAQVEQWVEKEANQLFAKEGAVLLMYGREPERIAFIHKLKFAAWSLLSKIQQNGWQVLETEKDLEGNFLDIPVKGRADLVLKKGEELAVLDLKWRGANRLERTIKNEEDLQLVLYSNLLSPDNSKVHTAYFIIEKGRLLARNNLAFSNIISIASENDQAEVNERILARMKATWRWRMNQLEKGQIEIRCEQTCQDLEDFYADNGDAASLMDLLEMKGDDAPFDDYQTLINLVQ